MIIGVDIGGTFTDVVCINRRSGDIHFTKVSTNYGNIIDGIVEGIHKILRQIGAETGAIKRIVHGTTVATNAIVQRRGAKTAVLTTAGFEDVLEIGRLKRRKIYDLNIDAQTPVFLAPRRFRVGIPERLDHDGTVLTPLDESAVIKAVTRLRRRHGIEAVAVCYLYGFRYPAHERRTGEIIKERFPGLFVSLSSEVIPVFREYERTMVTAFDAYMRPSVERFMAVLETQLRAVGITAEVHVMQSRGGVTSTRIAGQRPINLFLSGPAGGVVGGAHLARAAGCPEVVTLDIGGTSCDVALVVDGVPAVNPSGEIGDFSVPISMVGVNTIGAGGGSLLWIDAANVMRVGPRSAGSEPGPACYGRGGTDPTITDASLVLGYLNPVGFAGGELALDRAAAERALRTVADPLGLDPVSAALGAHRIMNVQMAEQIRLITIKRGHDPRRFMLMAFGGGGPLHAGALISMLGMKGCLVPQTPGVLSAFGLLGANFEIEQTTSFQRSVAGIDTHDLTGVLESLYARCLDVMRSDGFDTRRVKAAYSADMRYLGQSHEIMVPVPDGPLDAGIVRRMAEEFQARYSRLYGFSNKSDVEIVNVRAVAYEPAEPLDRFRIVRGEDARDAAVRESAAWFLGHEAPLPTRFYRRAALAEGAVVVGPAVVEQADTTVLVYPGQRAAVDALNNLVITGVSEAYTQ